MLLGVHNGRWCDAAVQRTPCPRLAFCSPQHSFPAPTRSLSFAAQRLRSAASHFLPLLTPSATLEPYPSRPVYSRAPSPVLGTLPSHA